MSLTKQYMNDIYTNISCLPVTFLLDLAQSIEKFC